MTPLTILSATQGQLYGARPSLENLEAGLAFYERLGTIATTLAAFFRPTKQNGPHHAARSVVQFG